MRASIKVIVASLGLIALQGTAAADDHMLNGQSRALYRSIAMQGDQALLDIRTSVVDSISQFMGHQMAVSLPQLTASDSQNASRQVGGDMDLTAMAMDH